MDSSLVIVAVIVILVLNAVILWQIFRRQKGSSGGEFLLMQNQLNEIVKTLDSKLSQSRQEMQEAVRHQFSQSQQLIKEINQEVSKNLIEVAKEQTKTNEAPRQFMTIAEQLANLEKVLKHQKQRGNLGEASLELILSNILPPDQFKMQYAFKDGETVDAVIFTKEGLIPIDAKFSLDNYNRVLHAIDDAQKEELEKEFRNDLKKRIDETAKYVKIEEKTLPFAFMFIPAEAIYYDLLINEVGSVKVNTRNLIDYAYNEKKVIIVSPTTFSAYLQSVLYGFKAFKIEESAKEIMKRVNDLGKHLKSYEDYHNRLGNALATTVNHFSASSKEFKKIDKDMFKITGSAIDIETLQLEKPVMEE